MEEVTPHCSSRPHDSSELIRRDADLEKLANRMKAGKPTAVLAPDGFGKTTLKLMLAQALRQETSTFVVAFDLPARLDEETLLNTFATSVMRVLPEAERTDALRRRLGAWSPNIRLGDGGPDDFRILLGTDRFARARGELAALRKAVFDLPEALALERGIRMMICIDRLESLAGCMGTGENDHRAVLNAMAAALRRQKSVGWAFFGNLRSQPLFDEDGPFQGTVVRTAPTPISAEEWTRHLVARLAAEGKSIAPGLAGRLAEINEGNPASIALFVRHLALVSPEVVKEHDLLEAEKFLRTALSRSWSDRLASLTRRQMNLLQAVAVGERQLTTSYALGTFGLGTSSTVARARSALIAKGILWPVSPRRGAALRFADPLFGRWIRDGFEMMPKV